MIRSAKRTAMAGIAGALLVGSCATGPQPTSGPSLVGTEWRLVEFESSDDSIGVIRPRKDELYSLRLLSDGSLIMGLSCNRGTGGWTSEDAHLQRGTLVIEPLASTMAACDRPSSFVRIGADMGRVRSFVIADGRLHLNLEMDGGNYVWLPTK